MSKVVEGEYYANKEEAMLYALGIRMDEGHAFIGCEITATGPKGKEGQKNA